MNPTRVFEIGLIIIALIVLLVGFGLQQRQAIDDRRDQVVEQTFEAEYGPRSEWEN